MEQGCPKCQYSKDLHFGSAATWKQFELTVIMILLIKEVLRDQAKRYAYTKPAHKSGGQSLLRDRV